MGPVTGAAAEAAKDMAKGGAGAIIEIGDGGFKSIESIYKGIKSFAQIDYEKFMKDPEHQHFLPAYGNIDWSKYSDTTDFTKAWPNLLQSDDRHLLDEVFIEMTKQK